MVKLCKMLNFADSFVVEAQSHSGGLALLWKYEGGCDIKESGNHYIYFEVENEQEGRWRYTGFHGCPEKGGDVNLGDY